MLGAEVLKKKLLLFLVVIYIFVLSGCGISEFINDFNPGFNSQINVNKDSETNRNPGVTEIAVSGNVVSLENDKTSYLRNTLLNKEEQIVYDIIYSGMKKEETSISLSPLTGFFASEKAIKEITSNAVFSVLRDHPEFFMYENSYSYTYETDFKAASVILKFETNVDFETAKLRQQKIDKVVNEIYEVIKDFDDYNKSKYVYTYLAQNITYGEGDNMYNMCGALIDGITKCDGYTKAYLYIMQKCGVEVGYICGEGKGDLHAWNIVKINGDWYYVDCTWGDPILENNDEMQLKNNVDYSYLHLTTDEILKNHTFDDIYLNLPEYKASKENYYIKEAFFFEKYNEKSLEDALYSKIKSANSRNSHVKIEIKYKNHGDAQKAYDWMNGDNIMKVAQKIKCAGFSYRKVQSDVGTFRVEIDFEF